MTKDNLPTGGCACGQYRYTSDAEIGFSFLCQCTQCQRATGSAHASGFVLPADQFQETGKLNWYETIADSGSTVSHGFCGTCGSPVMNRNTSHTDMVFIAASTLDNPDLYTPRKVLHRDTGRPWDLQDPQPDK